MVTYPLLLRWRYYRLLLLPYLIISTVHCFRFVSCRCIAINAIVLVVIPFILDVRLVDARAGITQEEGHIEFLHLPSAVPALTLIA